MTLSLTPFRPSQVFIGGELRHRMELTADKMLHGIDIERTFVRHFRERKAEPDVPGGFAGYGMFLDAIVKAAAHGIGGDELRAFKSHRLAELIDTQTPDGAITIFDGKIGFWDNHEQAYLIQALVLDHRHFGAASSLAAAIRLGDFLIALPRLLPLRALHRRAPRRVRPQAPRQRHPARLHLRRPHPRTAPARTAR